VVGFVGYDPGQDPTADVPTPMAPLLASGGVATVQERIPPELLSQDDVVTKADRERLQVLAGALPLSAGARASRPPRSMLALFFLALLAAAAGGISVMKCEKDRTAQGETRSGGR
jgi:hypothetical protein